MFERFTADARSVVVGAHAVARAEGAASIDSGHLLLALADRTDTVAARALASSGIDRDDLAHGDDLDAEALAAVGIDLAVITARTDEVFGTGSFSAARRPSRKGHLPFARDAKRTLEVSLREAIRLGDRSIDSRHLLLAMLRMGRAPAHDRLVAALRAAGSTPDALRSELGDRTGAA